MNGIIGNDKTADNTVTINLILLRRRIFIKNYCNELLKRLLFGYNIKMFLKGKQENLLNVFWYVLTIEV